MSAYRVLANDLMEPTCCYFVLNDKMIRVLLFLEQFMLDCSTPDEFISFTYAGPGSGVDKLVSKPGMCMFRLADTIRPIM